VHFLCLEPRETDKNVLKLSRNFLKIGSWNFTSCCWEPWGRTWIDILKCKLCSFHTKTCMRCCSVCFLLSIKMIAWELNIFFTYFTENANLSKIDSEASCANHISINLGQHDSQASIAFSTKFDQLAGSIFEHCSEAWNHDGDIYDVPQYPIAERQQKVHIVDEISYRYSVYCDFLSPATLSECLFCRYCDYEVLDGLMDTDEIFMVNRLWAWNKPIFLVFEHSQDNH